MYLNEPNAEFLSLKIQKTKLRGVRQFMTAHAQSGATP